MQANECSYQCGHNLGLRYHLIQLVFVADTIGRSNVTVFVHAAIATVLRNMFGVGWVMLAIRQFMLPILREHYSAY